MPRPYVLADIIDTFNTEISTALSPDVTDVQNIELVNNITSAAETPKTADGTPTVTVLAASSNQWDVGNWGALQWG